MGLVSVAVAKARPADRARVLSLAESGGGVSARGLICAGPTIRRSTGRRPARDPGLSRGGPLRSCRTKKCQVKKADAIAAKPRLQCREMPRLMSVTGARERGGGETGTGWVNRHRLYRASSRHRWCAGRHSISVREEVALPHRLRAKIGADLRGHRQQGHAQPYLGTLGRANAVPA